MHDRGRTWNLRHSLPKLAHPRPPPRSFGLSGAPSVNSSARNDFFSLFCRVSLLLPVTSRLATTAVSMNSALDHI